MNIITFIGDVNVAPSIVATMSNSLICGRMSLHRFVTSTVRIIEIVERRGIIPLVSNIIYHII